MPAFADTLCRIYTSINETKGIVGGVSVGKANFLMMAYYLCDLKQLLEELSQKEDTATTAFSEVSLKRLAVCVEKINKFVKHCSNSSRILLLFQSTELVCEVKNRLSELSECLNLMLQESISINITVEKEIKSVLTKLNSAMFYVEPENESIAKLLQEGLASNQIDKDFGTEVLHQISRHLSMRFSDSRELILELRNNIDFAKVEGRDSEVSLLQKLHSMLNSALIPPVTNSFDQPSSLLEDDLAIPRSFFCPITQQIMEDPVMLAETGYTYERFAILKWLEEGKRTCPVSTKELETFKLIPNLKLKQNIEEFFDLRRHKTMLHAIQQIEFEGHKVSDGAVNTIKSLFDIDHKYKFLLVTLNGIRPLVQILKPAEQLREKIHSILFSVACLGDGYKALIVQAGAVPILLHILHKNPAVNGGPVQLLWELSKCEYGRKAILEQKASVIIVAAAVNLCTYDQKLQAQQLLYNLCEQDNNAIAQAAVSEIFEPLVHKLNSGDATAQLGMLETISTLNKQSLHKLVNAGIVPPLLDILHHGAFDSKLKATRALKHLSSVDVNKVPITEAGTLPILVELLSSRDTELGLHILEILLNLATEKFSAGWIEREGAVKCLIDILKPGNTLLHETALKILACISKDSQTFRQSLVDLEVVPTLYNYLKRGNLQPSCHASIINIISYLSGDHRTRQAVANTPNMVKYFIDILQGSISLDEIESVLVILTAMVKVNETKVALLSESHLHQKYVDFLRSKREKIQECSVVILSKITDPASEDYANTQRCVTVDTTVLLNLARIGVIPCLVDLLKNGSERAKRHAAQTLRNLSLQTHQLSERQTLIKKVFAKLGLPKFKLCKVHAGKCSSKRTLCLVESDAVPSLIDLIKAGQCRSSKRAVEALYTLIKTPNDETVEKGIDYLVQRDIITHLVQLIGNNEGLTEKAVMMLERIFKCRKYRAQKYAQLAKHALYTTMATGNQNVRSLAVEALTHLKMVPQTSTYTKTN